MFTLRSAGQASIIVCTYIKVYIHPVTSTFACAYKIKSLESIEIQCDFLIYGKDSSNKATPMRYEVTHKREFVEDRVIYCIIA